jgi:hypothetical protein
MSMFVFVYVFYSRSVSPNAQSLSGGDRVVCGFRPLQAWGSAAANYPEHEASPYLSICGTSGSFCGSSDELNTASRREIGSERFQGRDVWRTDTSIPNEGSEMFLIKPRD